MAAYRRVSDSRHLQADCHNRDQLRNPTLANRVWATFFTALYPAIQTLLPATTSIHAYTAATHDAIIIVSSCYVIAAGAPIIS